MNAFTRERWGLLMRFWLGKDVWTSSLSPPLSSVWSRVAELYGFPPLLVLHFVLAWHLSLVNGVLGIAFQCFPYPVFSWVGVILVLFFFFSVWDPFKNYAKQVKHNICLVSLSKQNCAWPSCRCSPRMNAARWPCSLCTGAGLDGFLSNWSSSFCFLCLLPPPWMQCTGTSDLQPSLDRARSASTNCLRPDASLHSPERERYTVKTFLISYHFVQSLFFPITVFRVSEPHRLFIHVHMLPVCLSPPSRPSPCRDICVRGGAQGTHTHISMRVVANGVMWFVTASGCCFPFCCLSLVFFMSTQGAFSTLIWLWGQGVIWSRKSHSRSADK